ncbi:MAG: hypothetical protein Kow00107_11570 [Planctomycetota bacterium]
MNPAIPKMLKRPLDAHKMSVGVVVVIAGSYAYQGAGYLTTMAALRAGAGMVHFVFPAPLYSVYASKLNEPILHPVAATDSGSLSSAAWQYIIKLLEKADSFAVGPGLSTHPDTQELVTQLYGEAPVPGVFDADALNCLALREHDLALHAASRILTPHPGEYGRIAKDSGDSEQNIIEFSSRTRTVVVFKNSTPLVTDGFSSFTVTEGTPSLATAGTGDVLTGMVGAFLCKYASAFEAALAAAYAHGRAGRIAGEVLSIESVIASDLLGYIPLVIKDLIAE